MAVSDSNLTSSCCLFITINATKQQFLVDTAAYVCVYPQKLLIGKKQKMDYILFVPNNTTITTYSLLTLSGLRDKSTFLLTIHHSHSLLPNPSLLLTSFITTVYQWIFQWSRGCLVDQVTLLVSLGQTACGNLGQLGIARPSRSRSSSLLMVPKKDDNGDIVEIADP